MSADQQPTFEEWVEYNFTLGPRDFNSTSELSGEARWERQARHSLNPPLLTSYMTRLFEAPAFIADQFSDDQVAKGIWYIFGLGSEYGHALLSGDVPVEARARCVRSIATMYTDLFDRVCGNHGDDIDARSDDRDVDVAVYMIWDMGSGFDSVPVSKEEPLSTAAFEVVETALMKCVTAACQESALHGLGHLIGFLPPTAPSVARATALIDSFLSKRRPPDWLREYAAAARTGNVQ
jgi:hypothetical protein